MSQNYTTNYSTTIFLFLAKTSLDEIVSVELWSENNSNNNNEPRYTLTIVDGKKVNGIYAVFIVPQGIILFFNFYFYFPICLTSVLYSYLISTDLFLKKSSFFYLGQETDWLYSTKNGQNELSEKAGFQRLVIASLNRGHHYEGMEQIQEELSNRVLDLAPNNLPKDTKVIFICLSV